jgi:hypothetical protein
MYENNWIFRVTISTLFLLTIRIEVFFVSIQIDLNISINPKKYINSKQGKMKNKIPKIIITIVLSFLISNACQKDDIEIINIEKINDDLTISEAKHWYESQFIPELLKNVGFSKSFLEVKPNWELSCIEDHPEFTTVEVSLVSKGMFGFATKESSQLSKGTSNINFLQSSSSLIILRKKKENIIIGFIMTLIPDPQFRIKTGYDCFRSHYQKWQEGYCGYVLYHDLDGTFSNGLKFIDGEITKEVHMNLNSNLYINLEPDIKSEMDTPCENYALVAWYVDCVEWYTNGVYTNTTCGAPYSEIVYTFSVCQPVGVGGDGHYQDGLQTGAPPRTYIPQEGDRFSNPNVRLLMQPQQQNLCVPAIMKYLNDIYCGGTMSEDDYAQAYINIYGESPYTDGVDVNNIEEFTGNYFSLAPWHSGYYYDIQRGRAIMLDVPTDNPNIFHNIAVVGYHPDGSIIIMDPSKGYLEEVSPYNYQYGQKYKLSITGCQ